MTNEELHCWLKGFFTLEKSDVILTTKQLSIINNHLNLVQSVMGVLDDDNQWLKNYITESLNDGINSENNVSQLKIITETIRKRYLE